MLGGHPPGATMRSRSRLVDGRYRVDALLGKGAMGAVFRVHDVTQGRDLALKRLNTNADDSRTGRRRSEVWFRREFHTVARLRHPSVVEIYDFGLDAGRPYYTMELLEGQDLRDLSDLDVATTCRLIRGVASALAFLHARRLLHRDLKARNVRCTRDGRAKLIDFGVMATMGVAGDVAGTPPSIPPEALRGLPLDGRADLFGLGALSYWLLTKRHAYPARKLSELERVWQTRPAPPSTLCPDVPATLDDLVMSLLAIDRAGRPATASEVSDRLVAIAGLEPEPAHEVAQGWLLSAAIVGRDREIERIRGVIRTKPGSGRPRAVVVQAPSGMGKTRLLRETGLEGQVAGATVLTARGGRSGTPFDVVHQIARSALTACPGDVARTVGPHAAVIGHVVPAVLELTGTRPAQSVGDPMEDRMRLQVELLRWFRALSRTRSFVVLVDELQRCDEASAAFLAALARERTMRDGRIVIIGAQRTDEPVTARAAIAALRDNAELVTLAGLDENGVTQLVHALFGAVPHGERLAAWIHRVAGGSPMYCMELARHLVDSEIVRYAEGTWIVSPDLGAVPLPDGFAQAMDARVRALPEGPRAMAEVLAVIGSRVSLEICVGMVGMVGRQGEDTGDVGRAFEALDELVLGDVILGDPRGFEIRHDGLREALLRGMADERRRTLHRRAARVLDTTEGLDAAREVEIGWHYLHGGDELEGARRLESAGRRLYAAHSFAEALGPIEAALDVYERRGGPRRSRLELRHMLMRAGVICDREIIVRHADQTIEAFRQDSGLTLAARLRPLLGGHLALVVGLFASTLDWLRPGARSRRTSPIASLTTLITLVNYAASVHSLTFVTERLLPLIELLRPLRVLRNRIPGIAYLMVKNFLWIAEGKFDHLHRNTEALLQVIEQDDRTPLNEIDRKLARGACHFMQASARSLDQDPEYETSCQALDAIELRFFQMGGRMARALFHRLRGEEALAERIKSETEIFFVQLGNAWVFESQHAWISSIAYGMTGDVSGLKRSIEELERLNAAGYRLEGFARVARGEYLREVGDPVASRIALQRAHEELPKGNLLLEQLTLSALADTLLVERNWTEVRAVAEHGLAPREDGEQGSRTARLRLGRARALALAFSGDIEVARSELDALLQQAQLLGSPLLLGSLHEAQAIVARETGEEVSFRLHAERARQVFASTDNPVLVARAERSSAVASSSEERARVAAPNAEEHTVRIDRDELSDRSISGDEETEHSEL